MLLVQAAQLIYDGAGMHEIKNVSNLQQSVALLNRSKSHALAEHIMRKIDYANSFRNRIAFDMADSKSQVSREASRQINHIHHQCQEEIESK